MRETKDNWRRAAALIAILLLATALRFYLLDAQSFWNDEGNSARLSERSLRLIIEGTASDIHPPFYYLLLRGWRELLGATEFSLRAVSAFAGVLTVAATVALGRRLGDWWVAGLGGLLTAVSPPLIYYSQEARMYSLLALLAVLATLFFWRLVFTAKQHSGLRPTGHWPLKTGYGLWVTGYCATAVAGLYTHYFFPTILISHNLLYAAHWLRLKQRRLPPSAPPLLHWIALNLVILLLYLPWLPIFLRSTGGGTAATLPFFTFLWSVGWWLVGGATLQAQSWAMAAVGLALTTAVVHTLRPSARWAGALLFVWLLLPIVFMFGVGATEPQFFKFLTATVPALWLAAAVGLVWLGHVARPLGALAGLLLLAAVGWAQAQSLQNLYFNPTYARADYRAIAAQISAEAPAGAAVLLNAPNQWEVFTYYYPDTAAVYPLPKTQAAAESVAAEAAIIAQNYTRLYALFWGDSAFDQQRRLESWLDTHLFKAREEWRGDVRFVTYAVGEDEAAVTPLGLPFGEAIRLQGYSLPQRELGPGEIVQLTLVWEAKRPLETRYKVFIHLLNAEGMLVAQRDSEPVGNLAPTTGWPVGERIVDRHGIFLPQNLPAGEYQLLVGLYDAANPNARLPIETAEGTLDALPLATLKIR